MDEVPRAEEWVGDNTESRALYDFMMLENNSYLPALKQNSGRSREPHE